MQQQAPCMVQQPQATQLCMLHRQLAVQLRGLWDPHSMQRPSPCTPLGTVHPQACMQHSTLLMGPGGRPSKQLRVLKLELNTASTLCATLHSVVWMLAWEQHVQWAEVLLMVLRRLFLVCSMQHRPPRTHVWGQHVRQRAQPVMQRTGLHLVSSMPARLVWGLLALQEQQGQEQHTGWSVALSMLQRHALGQHAAQQVLRLMQHMQLAARLLVQYTR
jgi:hypothetical protein